MIGRSVAVSDHADEMADPVVQVEAADLSTTLAGVAFPNPIFTASGCAAAGRELAAFCDVSELGAVVTKSVMRNPRTGRPTPRMAETPSGMLNSIGLQGPGLASFLEHDLPWLAQNGARAIVSIAGGVGGGVRGAGPAAARVRRGLSMVEVNISCPNVADRGHVFACSVSASADVLAAVRRELSGTHYVPVLAKLSPDVTDIVAIAKSVVDAGADGLSLINTLLGMVIDPVTLRPALAGITGGPFRPGGATGSAALRLSGALGAAVGADPRDGRCPHRGGCPGVPGGRRVSGLGGHGGLRRSGSAPADHRRAAGRTDAAQIALDSRRDRHCSPAGRHPGPGRATAA